jgi:DNA-binding transcriptional regulator YiaG
MRPTSGTAAIAGADCVRDAWRIKRLVGYMPDTFGAYDNMRVREYLDFFGAAFGIPRGARAKRIDEVLETTGNLATRFTCRTIRLQLEPKEYSGTDVKKVRDLLGVSQPLFAQFAGVSAAAIRDWEQNIKPPTKTVCRLMDEITSNPSTPDRESSKTLVTWASITALEAPT